MCKGLFYILIMTKKYKYILFFSFFLIFSILLVYLQSKNFDFIAYDDGTYIQANQAIKNGLNIKSIKWAFTSFYASNYHPITWISHIIDYTLYKNNAGDYHIANVIIHILNTLLLFFFLLKATDTIFKSFFVAFFFALHPIHVESVVWIAERKDLLCCFFYFLSIYFYIDYVKESDTKKYYKSFFAFILSLLSKPMAVTLPCVLILFDFWPLERKNINFFKLIKEKIPFFIGSFILSFTTMLAQKGAIKDLSYLPFKIKYSNAITSYFTYIYKTFLPINFGILYPHSLEFSFLKTSIYSIVFVIILIISLHYRKKKPYLTFSWLFYVGTLVPVIGFIQVGGQSMADRYSYIPLTGVFIATVWLSDSILNRFKHKKNIIKVLVSFIAFSLFFLTFKQVSYWRNSFTLFEHTIKITENINKKTPTNIPIRNNLALMLLNKGKVDEAYKILKNVKHTHHYFQYTLGIISMSKQKYNEAIQHFSKAITIDPTFEYGHIGLGKVYQIINQKDKAIKVYEDALLKNKDFDTLRKYLIYFYIEKGELKPILKHSLFLHKKFPKDIGILDIIAKTYGNLGKVELSNKYFLKIKEIQFNELNNESK